MYILKQKKRKKKKITNKYINLYTILIKIINNYIWQYNFIMSVSFYITVNKKETNWV